MALQPSTDVLDIRDILWRARRHVWLILLMIVAFACGGVLYLKFTAPVYEAAAILSVENPAPVSSALGSLVNPSPDRVSGRDRVRQVNDRIHSRAFLADLVKSLGLDRNPRLLAQAREASQRWPGITPEDFLFRIASRSLSKSISATFAGEWQIRLSARDTSPARALDLVNRVANSIITERRQATLEEIRASGEFSNDQIRVYEERLSKSEDQLRQFQESMIGKAFTSNPIQDTNFDQAKALLREIDQEMAQLRDRIAQTHQTWDTETGGGAAAPTLSSPEVATLESRLEQIEANYGRAQLRRDAHAPEAAALGAQVAGARQALFDAYERLAHSVPGDYTEGARMALTGLAVDRAVLVSLRGKRSLIAELVNDYVHNVESAPRQQMELNRLKGEVDANRALVTALRREATSSRLSEALQSSELGFRVGLTEAAELPLEPVWPNRIRILGGALVLGPLFAIGLVFAIERLGGLIQTVEQAEHEVGARVIGTIPRVEGWSRPGSYIQRNWAVLSVLLVLLVTGALVVTRSLTAPGHLRSGASSIHRP